MFVLAVTIYKFIDVNGENNTTESSKASTGASTLTTQAQWVSGNKVKIDSDSLPGSIKLYIPAIECRFSDDTLAPYGGGGGSDYSQLVDKNLFTGHLFANESTPSGLYYLIDFKTPVSMDMLKVASMAQSGGPSVGVNIDYWDGASWVNVSSGTLIDYASFDYSDDSNFKTFSFGAISASKIRVKHTSGTYVGTLSGLREIRPYYNGAELYDTASTISAVHTSAATQIDGTEGGTKNFVSWETFTPTYTKPANTNVQFRFRSSADGSSWTSWSASQTPTSGNALDISALVDSASGANKYLQVEATLSNTDGVSTPIIDSYDIGYHTNVAPSAPSNLTAVVGE